MGTRSFGCVPACDSVAIRCGGRRTAAGAVSHYRATTPCHHQVWDVKTGTLLRTQHGHKGAVTCLAYSSTCKLLFSASIDNTIGIWTDKGVNLQASGTPTWRWGGTSLVPHASMTQAATEVHCDVAL